MKITEFLHREAIIASLQSKDRAGVMEELCQAIGRSAPSIPREQLLQVLLERERLSSTGIGEGVAIPHGKLPGLPGLVGAFGVSHEGIEFNSIDGKPAYLFFVILAPDTSAGLHLKALARISRLFKSPAFRKAIVDTRDPETIFDLIATEDDKT